MHRTTDVMVHLITTEAFYSGLPRWKLSGIVRELLLKEYAKTNTQAYIEQMEREEGLGTQAARILAMFKYLTKNDSMREKLRFIEHIG